MEIEKLNIYNCLRDFNVPAAVLDEIFANEQDLNILIDAWRDLRKTGLKHDEISEKVSKFYNFKLFRFQMYVCKLD